MSAWLLAVVLLAGITSCAASSGGGPPQTGDEPEVAPAAMANQQRLSPPAAEPFQRFGGAVAISDEQAIVGAIGSQAGGSAAGAAHIFDLSSPEAPVASLEAPAGQEESLFGNAVAIAGEVAVVGAPFDSADGDRAGAAYVFQRTESGWQLAARLAPADAQPLAYFGEVLAIDGDTIAVGAPGPGAGKAYVFRRTSGDWQQVASLASPEPTPDARFGSSLALAASRLAVGSWTSGQEPGSVHLYRLSEGGWQHEWSTQSPERQDRFGFALDLEEGILAVGAPGGAVPPAVYLYRLTAGSWQAGSVLAPPSQDAFGFGTAVALGSGFLVVAAPTAGNEPQGAGVAFLYELASGQWQQLGTLRSASAMVDEEFGAAVAVDRGTVLVGAPGAGPDRSTVGAAYRFAYPPDPDGVERGTR